MLTFMSVALLIYGSMHLYAFGKVWMAFPHSFGLGLALVLAGMVLTFSPLLVWYMERQNWHGATVATAWVSYTWMGFLFLFFCIGLAVRSRPCIRDTAEFQMAADRCGSVPDRIPARRSRQLGYGLIEARQIQIEKVNITTPKLASGRVTIAQISDLHLGMMHGRRISRPRHRRSCANSNPTSSSRPGTSSTGRAMTWMRLRGASKPTRRRSALMRSSAITNTMPGWKTRCDFLRSAGFTVLRGESAAGRRDRAGGCRRSRRGVIRTAGQTGYPESARVMSRE